MFPGWEHLILFLFGFEGEERPAIEVTAYEIAKYLADIDYKYFCLQHLFCRRNKEIEGICDRVGEATKDEYRHTQQERKHLTLTGKLYSRCQDKSTTNSQQETSKRSFRQTTCENLRGWFDTVRLRIGDEPGCKQTADNITQQYQSQHYPVTLQTDEASRTRIEFQTVIHYRRQSKGAEGSGTSAPLFPQMLPP